MGASAQSSSHLRGCRVMLSTDLARLYGVEPRALVQAVKRNAARFPPDFMFQLAPAESRALRSSRSQSVILKRGSNVKYAPHAFTQEGVAMPTATVFSTTCPLDFAGCQAQMTKHGGVDLSWHSTALTFGGRPGL
jgi:hypothetical protein